MRQRGRQSAAASEAANVVVLAVDGRAERRLQPPAGLNKAERSLFSDLTATAGHFSPSDVPMLAAYCQAVLMSRRSARDPARLDVWEKSTRLMASLATKLRLTPQARTDAKTVARRQHSHLSYYERMRLDDQNDES